MASAKLQCVVVTPEETVLDAGADYVVVPLFDGELGIAAKHSPMIGRLGFGVLKVKSGGETTRYFVDGGFVQVSSDVGLGHDQQGEAGLRDRARRRRE